MNYEIINTAERALSVLLTAEKNEITWKTMYSNKDLYLQWLWQMCFRKDARVVGVFNEYNYCLGFLVLALNKLYDYQEIFIHDVYVMEEARKSEVSSHLYQAVVDAFNTSDVKQLRWCSSQVPEIYWQDKLKTLFDFKVNTIKYHTVLKSMEEVNVHTK